MDKLFKERFLLTSYVNNRDSIKSKQGEGVVFSWYNIQENPDDFYAYLTPLSNISDKHAIEVARIVLNKPVTEIVHKANRTVIRCNDTINPHERWLVSIWHDTGNISVHFKKGDDWIECHNHNQKAVFDYLVEESYALPFGGKSVEELIKLNLLKLK